MGLDPAPAPPRRLSGPRSPPALGVAALALLVGGALAGSRTAGAAPADPPPQAPLPAPRYVPGGAPLQVGPRIGGPAGAPRPAAAARPAPGAPARPGGPARKVDLMEPLPAARNGYRVTVEDAGHAKQFPAKDGLKAVVLTGNPVVSSTAGLKIRANVIVVWLDANASSGLAGLFGEGGAPSGAKKGKGGKDAAKDAKKPPAAGALPPPVEGSIVPEALVAVYAEGAVDFEAGTTAFRASRMYLDARTNRALLVEPRFQTVVPMNRGQPEVTIQGRAERARIVSEGLAVLDRAQLTMGGANDSVQMRINRMTIEEYGQPAPKETTVLGFRTGGSPRDGATGLENVAGTRHFVFEGIHARGERLPLAYFPRAEFGGEEGLTRLPIHLHVPRFGSRSSLGRYLILPVSGDFVRDKNRHVEWTLEGGGFTKRGFAGGADLEWHIRGPVAGPDGFRPRLDGKIDTFLVNDLTGDDRNGFDAGRGPRWKFELENRWDPRPDLRFDAEFNAFSDRGFDNEYFESDFNTHKDRETYVRTRWMQGGTAVTAMAGAHMRDFVTESLRQPAVDLWSESVPLTPRSSRIALDLSSEASAVRLVRRFDEADTTDEDYEAVRLDAKERIYAPFDLGDVRVSPFVGVRATGYYNRTDGGDDVTRTALETGIRANLQLHRDFSVYGGPWHLDGMRHVIDLDVGAYARFDDSYDPADVPYFDRIDQEEDRTEVFFQVGTRIETRREVLGVRRNASLLDLTVRLDLWPDRKGPYEKRGPGEVETRFAAMLAPERLWLRGESVSALEGAAFEHSSLSLEYSPHEDLAIGAGIRHVHDETLAPWVDVYWRYSEKWGVMASAIKDYESGRAESVRFSVLRFAEDHSIELGFSVRNGGDDFGFILDIQPLIGGAPVRSPFDPRDRIDFTP